MKTHLKPAALLCAAILCLSACQAYENTLMNARASMPGGTPPAAPAFANHPRYSPNTLEEMEYQLAHFYSGFFGSFNLPHAPAIQP